MIDVVLVILDLAFKNFVGHTFDSIIYIIASPFKKTFSYRRTEESIVAVSVFYSLTDRPTDQVRHIGMGKLRKKNYSLILNSNGENHASLYNFQTYRRTFGIML